MDHEEAAEEYATFLFDTAMAIFFAGSILGGFVIQPAAEHLGRRKAYMVDVVTYIIACGITILAKEVGNIFGTTVEQLQAEFNGNSCQENKEEIEMLEVQN
ncbi:unnamed protein product [Caenorhabditis nigoni]